MTDHFDRGMVLLSQQRVDLAEAEFRRALAEDPDDGVTHGFLSLCLTEREEYKEATQEAMLAIGKEPDHPLGHYAMANTLSNRGCYDEALAAIDEAIRLDPEEVNHFGLKGSIYLDLRQWEDAVAAADEGLAIDPEDAQCLNIRAMSLTKLGRHNEVDSSLDAALKSDPNDSVTHANRGWMLLHRGKPQEALESFREALRIDPQNEWARAGIVEALKSRNVVYRLMLKYFLWMSCLSGKVQWGVMIGLYFVMRFMINVAKANATLAPFLLPIIILGVLFVFLSWTAQPLFNLLLRLNRFGRLALSRDQIIASNWIGGCILGLVLSVAAALLLKYSVFIAFALFFWLGVIPLAATFKCDQGWPRKVMTIYTSIMALTGLSGIAITATKAAFTKLPEGAPRPDNTLGFALLCVFLIGAFGASWVGNALGGVRVRR